MASSGGTDCSLGRQKRKLCAQKKCSACGVCGHGKIKEDLLTFDFGVKLVH